MTQIHVTIVSVVWSVLTLLDRIIFNAKCLLDLLLITIFISKVVWLEIPDLDVLNFEYIQPFMGVPWTSMYGDCTVIRSSRYKVKQKSLIFKQIDW